jgi:hypothetical protein
MELLSVNGLKWRIVGEMMMTNPEIGEGEASLLEGRPSFSDKILSWRVDVTKSDEFERRVNPEAVFLWLSPAENDRLSLLFQINRWMMNER